jgi:polyribonucleotide nucleotidyltransferase
MKPYSLYELEFPNGKKYLGITHQPDRRWIQQCQASAREKQDFPLYKAIRKYGSASVKRRILVVGTLEFIREMEIAAIAKYDTLVPQGYNVALGGQISPSAVPEVLKKMSEGQRRAWANPEYKEKMRAKFKERVRSDEHKVNLSLAKKKEWQNSESRQKYIDSHLGKKPSEETRKKMSAAQKGHPPRNYRPMLRDAKGRIVRALTEEEIRALTHTTESK